MNEDTPYRYFGMKEQGGLFGVEVEVEGLNLPRAIEGFDVKDDGSLRGESAEYVFSSSKSFVETLRALNKLSKSFDNSKLDMSFRTSVHVHVNVQNLNHNQLCKFLYLAFLFENPLVNFCGPSRVGNRFCLRVVDSFYKIGELEQIFEKGFQYIQDQGRVKYSAINLHTIAKFGSVEFRSMRGTISYDVLSKWIKMLNALYIYSQQKEVTIKGIADSFCNDPITLGKEVFGEELFSLLEYKQMREEMNKSFTLLVNLPYLIEE